MTRWPKTGNGGFPMLHLPQLAAELHREWLAEAEERRPGKQLRRYRRRSKRAERRARESRRLFPRLRAEHD